jgi:PAS domain S-box-containing protein
MPASQEKRSRPRLRWPVVAMVVAAVLGAVVYQNVLMHRRADNAGQAVSHLGELDLLLHEESSLQWKTLADRSAPVRVARELGAIRHRERQILDDLGRSLPDREARELRERIDRYHQVLDEELGLLAVSRTADALRLEQHATDPQFVELRQDIAAYARLAGGREGRANGTANLTLGAAMLMATIMIGTLFQRFERAHRAAADITDELLQQERRALQQAKESAAELTAARDSALAAQEEFRTAFENTPIGMALVSPDGRWLRVNRALGLLVGLDADELAGTPVDELVHPDDREQGHAQLRMLLDGAPESEPLEQRYVHVDGHVRTVVRNISLLCAADGSARHFIAQLRDVTSRKQLEVELRHAQKLEAIGRLAGGVAHEINTPIQFIGDNVRFLSNSFEELLGILDRAAVRDDDIDYLAQEVPAAIRQTLEGVDRVATIVRAMKIFGHPDHGGPAAADLNQALESTITVARHELRDVAEVETDLEPLPPVTCQIGELNQVFLNLLVNAAHAVGDARDAADGDYQGRITVRSRPDGDFVVIQIADTGTGIPPEAQDRIFEPFFTTKEVGRGTGQGLSLARVVVDRHGGQITFDTTQGRGTTFTIRMPVTPPSAAEHPAVSAAGSPLAPA